MAKSCGTSVRGVGRLSPGRIGSGHVELVSSHGLARRLRLSRGHGGLVRVRLTRSVGWFG
jgi:hypothetical protein